MGDAFNLIDCYYLEILRPAFLLFFGTYSLNNAKS